MKKNKIKLTLFLIVLLAMTACNNREVGNGNTNVAESTSQLASEIVPEAVFQFNAASGKVYAIKTAVLCLTPEKGSGYADFIFKGTEVTLKGIDESGTWSVVNYNGADYYILSSYLAAQSGEKLDEGGAEDLITGEMVEVQIVTEVSEEGEVTTTVTVTKPQLQEETTEISLEGSTSEETKPSGTGNTSGNGSTMSNGTLSSGSSSAATKPLGSTSVKTTEAVTKAPKPTQASKPTQAPKPTQASKPTQAATQAPTQPVTQAATEAPTQSGPQIVYPTLAADFDPYYVIEEATRQLKAAGYRDIYDILNEQLAAGIITQEDYDVLRPQEEGIWFEVNTDYSGFSNESMIYELVESCKYLCVEGYFHIEPRGYDEDELYPQYIFRVHR